MNKSRSLSDLCGTNHWNAERFAPGFAPLCILQKGHTGPHTDGEQQWTDENFINRPQGCTCIATRCYLHTSGFGIVPNNECDCDTTGCKVHAEPSTLDSNYDLAKAAPASTHTEDEQAMYNTFMERIKPFVPGATVYTFAGKGEIIRVDNIKDQLCPYHVKYSDGLIRIFSRAGLSLNPANAPKGMQCDSQGCILQHGHKDAHDFGSCVEVPTIKRKVVQIAPAGVDTLYGLCNDGTIWQITIDKPWFKILDIPQD